ncbi:heparin lyase I family protein [Actinomycetospora atypica]|uniref:Heparin lyase I family protein n=1 Tax=Actinomycetospora atypica TaxID=1290095 RepID=A0ABV9YQL8_9PSEU
MARHRSGSSPTPRTGSWPAALDAPATGPRAYGSGRHRHDPATTPLDLAAIARAAAEARGDRPDEAAPAAPAPAPLAAAPRHQAAPEAPAPHTPARARSGRALSTTRAAGALALFGALAGASVAAASTGPSFLADPPADTGEFLRPDTQAVAPAGVVRPEAPRVATATTAPAPTTTQAPPPTTTAPPAPRDDGGKTLWSADFAGKGLKNFKSTPWNNQGAKSPTLSGGLLNFSMPGGGKRSEIEPNFRSLSEGDEYYFGFSVRLAPDFPVNTSDWQVITQFKNDGTGSPPLELKVQDGKFLIDGDSGGFSQVVGDATPGQWTHLVLKVRFSSSDGTVSAWQDGVQKIADYAPPSGTLYSGKDSYVKTGIYRDPSIGQAGKLAFGSWAIGTSLGAVSKDLPAGTD